MSCPKCTICLIRHSKRPRVTLASTSRTFHTSPARQRLGAFTYAQEWQTGTYHYNKALSKTLPVAAQKADELLTMYATQRERRVDPSSPLYAQLTRQHIAQQRRSPDRILISKPTAKEYVDRVEVTAFVYDGVAAAEAERTGLAKRRMGVKDPSAAGGNQRKPAARRRSAGGAAMAGAMPGAPARGRMGFGVGRRAPGASGLARGPPRSPGSYGPPRGPPRTLGSSSSSGLPAGQRPETSFRSIKLGPRGSGGSAGQDSKS